MAFVNHEGKGVYGFEQANNQTLSGRDGMLKTVTDARDVPLTIGDKNVRQPAVNGQSKPQFSAELVVATRKVQGFLEKLANPPRLYLGITAPARKEEDRHRPLAPGRGERTQDEGQRRGAEAGAYSGRLEQLLEQVF